METKRICKFCNYFEQVDAIEKMTRGKAGLCRYNPPLMMENMTPVAQWPVVQIEDWCGKFANQTHEENDR